MTETKAPTARSGRLKLVLIMLVFLTPIIAAGILTLTGWQPQGKGNGQPILPQRSFEGVRVDVGGKPWAWRDSEPRLTLVVLPGPACAAECVKTLGLVRNARIVLNRNADRLRLLYLGPAPDSSDAQAVMADYTIGTEGADTFAPFRPTTADSVALVLVESNATALAWYPAGFDPNGLRKDLQKVIR
jgi:hypothetical protein